MFITPFLAAVLIGSFWTGVGTAAVVSNGGLLTPPARSDVVITAEPSDHLAVCHARYRSYQEDGMHADMWLGRDGAWHVCAL